MPKKARVIFLGWDTKNMLYIVKFKYFEKAKQIEKNLPTLFELTN